MREELYKWLIANWSKLTQHQRQYVMISFKKPKGF
jgi:predicted Fe-S protein YdhL (DUF1289 family)